MTGDNGSALRRLAAMMREALPDDETVESWAAECERIAKQTDHLESEISYLVNGE